MGRFARFALFVLKWLLVPVGFAALGYYVVGPKIGETNIPLPRMAKTPETKVAPVVPDEPPPNLGEPDVKVRVVNGRRNRSKPATVDDSTDSIAVDEVKAEPPKRTNKRRRKPKPAPVEAPSSGADEAGAGGTDSPPETGGDEPTDGQ